VGSGTDQLHVPKANFCSLFLQIPVMADRVRPCIFCDWITIRQTHDQPVPVLNGGYVVSFEPEAFSKSWQIDEETGETKLAPMFDATKAEYTTHKRIEHEGSYETKISVRSDGYTVELSGNVSRFGRPDNLFGLTVPECFEKANQLIQALGLPAFSELTDLTPMARTDTHTAGQSIAHITRVDITQNLCAGSREKALRYIHSMAGQASMARGKGNNAPKGYGNGVTWNEGSKRWYCKLYYKGDELGKYASEQLKKMCEELGVVRFEISLKARELADLGLNRILPWCRVKEGKSMAEIIYGKFSEVLRRNSVSTLELSDIPGKLGLVAQSYMTGNNPLATASKRVGQKWRKALLEYGIDIKVPLDVTRLSARVVVIELQPLAVPDWYLLESA